MAVYAGLALLVFAAFGQTVEHRFINYDDSTYVYENPRIAGGLTVNGIISAFVQPHAQNWHPLTTLSHMLDCELWGLNPAGHHLVNVLLHLATTLLLFGALHSITRNIWRSALVAAVFAVHPLRVESVAWIAERKDVLSGVFFVLTILAYVHYVREQRISRYLLTFVCFALALMSKPTVITLPVLLLFLDYWPLKRVAADIPGRDNKSAAGRRNLLFLLRSRILLEKIPLLFLSAISAVVTLVVQRQTVEYSQAAPLTVRLVNAATVYVTYLGQMVWPSKLSVFYPQADKISATVAVGAALFLFVVTALVIWSSRRHPFLLVGWCWYLVCLIPVSGLVQVGLQAHADRYTYLPGIGLTLGLVWYAADLASLRALSRRWAPTVGVVIVLLWGWRASIQASFWKDSETLWRHALSVTQNNEVAHNNVAALLVKEGRIDEAIVHYQAALRIAPRLEMHNHLSPAIIENSLGNAFAEKGDLDAAIGHYRSALVVRPDFADARSNLSAMLLREHKVDEAVTEYTKVVATPPEDALSHERLATMLVQENRLGEAVSHYRRAIQLSPDEIDSINALAWILATSVDPNIRNGEEALTLAEQANEIGHGNQPVVLRILAASYAACGRSAEALATARRALALAQSNPALSRALQVEIEVYGTAGSRAP